MNYKKRYYELGGVRDGNRSFKAFGAFSDGDFCSVEWEERGIGEEIFLKPLYGNVNERTNPGKRILDSLKEGISLEEIIKDYGDL